MADEIARHSPFLFRPRCAPYRSVNRKKTKRIEMDVERIKQEMRVLAESRIDRIAGQDVILLHKNLAAKVCGKSAPWIEHMVAAGRLPVIRIGQKDWVQRPTVVEMLVNGL
jgi:hypothetical protein